MARSGRAISTVYCVPYKPATNWRMVLCTQLPKTVSRQPQIGPENIHDCRLTRVVDFSSQSVSNKPVYGSMQIRSRGGS